MIHFHRSRSGKLRLPLGRYLVLALLMLYLSSATTYGNYISQAGGSDSVQVAKFAPEISVTSNDPIATNDGIDTATYSLRLDNTNSETKVSYHIAISNIPNGVKVCVNDVFQSPDKGVFKFEEIVDYGKDRTISLTFKADDGAEAVAKQKITITATAEQVD